MKYNIPVIHWQRRDGDISTTVSMILQMKRSVEVSKNISTENVWNKQFLSKTHACSALLEQSPGNPSYTSDPQKESVHPRYPCSLHPMERSGRAGKFKWSGLVGIVRRIGLIRNSLFSHISCRIVIINRTITENEDIKIGWQSFFTIDPINIPFRITN